MAGVLVFDKYYGLVYNCNTCLAEDKTKRGCDHDIPDSKIWVECICNKQDASCQLCGGGGMITLARCPRSLLISNRNVARIIPYFMDWLFSNYVAYPDGRGRFFQPVALISAFDVLLQVNQNCRGEK